MQFINYSTARQNFTAIMDKVYDDSEPVFINRKNGKVVVIMSLAEFNSLNETFHIMKSPVMHSRLLKSIEEDKKDNLCVHELIDV
ncbi:type II toxin-antitoxin system prevent-host-death family antitoxin [Pantoea sp. Al-1710]|uniref:Antitoxin n=1 Tax=Candidatus Pantoea communis TaxID=2608354 RepID=A0ABX0RNP4_9GAMM|nr:MULTISPECIES: type II toxin-antitoxin system prevent-host-death family antitoxin [Pantoea]NIG12945.1 type II toxin-antitoxin system prevent-host-death family antitoxin [Pantoea sp. Cy-640]NIG17354.1 type II toxin-antitoxin system prevent-host-death family antitoxin [Pantoea communis]